MITAQELRIGNWVNDAGMNWIKIDEIKNPLPLYYPIKITGDILYNFGFMKHYKSSHYFLRLQNGYEIVFDETSDIVLVETTEDWFVPFVQPLALHDLQNLYYVLCRRELELNSLPKKV